MLQRGRNKRHATSSRVAPSPPDQRACRGRDAGIRPTRRRGPILVDQPRREAPMPHHIPELALAASIVASVTGALVMCALVFRYGFTVPVAADSEGGPTPADVLVTRVGHAVAGACFAATAVLAIVGLTARTPQRAGAATAGAVPVAPVSMATQVEALRPAPPSAS